jgi:hypothetical protein
MDENRPTRWTITLMCVLMGAGLIWAFHTGQQRGSHFECDGTTVVTAVSGDTLWGIASEHCEGNRQAAVHAIREMNGEGSALQIGQQVYLPSTRLPSTGAPRVGGE